MSTKPPTITIKSKHGGKKVRAVLNASQPGGVKVGILMGMGEHPNADGGQSIAQIAFWNEFGTDDGRIPERSFLRAGLRENLAENKELIQQLLRRMLTLKVSVKQAAGTLGAKAAGQVKAKIVSGPFVENAESTLAAKEPKTKPLIETGILRKSITHEVIGMGE
jgi:hypothetical protein